MIFKLDLKFLLIHLLDIQEFTANILITEHQLLYVAVRKIGAVLSWPLFMWLEEKSGPESILKMIQVTKSI
jgi:hypothetical protein